MIQINRRERYGQFGTAGKGHRDYLPHEVKVRDAIKSIILRSYENNGFSKIRTPILEDIDRLDKSEGGENLNMIFRILKRVKTGSGQRRSYGKRSCGPGASLRFDTAPVQVFCQQQGELEIAL